MHHLIPIMVSCSTSVRWREQMYSARHGPSGKNDLRAHNMGYHRKCSTVVHMDKGIPPRGDVSLKLLDVFTVHSPMLHRNSVSTKSHELTGRGWCRKYERCLMCFLTAVIMFFAPLRALNTTLGKHVFQLCISFVGHGCF